MTQIRARSLAVLLVFATATAAWAPAAEILESVKRVCETCADFCSALLEKTPSRHRNWRAANSLPIEVRRQLFLADPKVQKLIADQAWRATQRPPTHLSPAERRAYAALEDPVLVFETLAKLEKEVSARRSGAGRGSLTKTLDEVLSDYERDGGFAAAVSVEGFLEAQDMSRLRRNRQLFTDYVFPVPRRIDPMSEQALEDPNNHGVWVHRLQWHVILRSGVLAGLAPSPAEIYASMDNRRWDEIFDRVSEESFRSPHVFTLILGRYFSLVR